MVADLTGEIAWRAIFTARESHGAGDEMATPKIVFPYFMFGRARLEVK